MKNTFFVLIYIKTNRFSDEKWCIGVLANFNGIPYFGYSSNKLTQALKYIDNKKHSAIRKSFKWLENEVNKYVKGEEVLPLFDEPYSKKVLERLTLKKRGMVTVSDLYPLESNIDFSLLYKKYVGEKWEIQSHSKAQTLSFRKRFNQFIADNKFNKFYKKYTLKPQDYPDLISSIKVDLLKAENSFTTFQMIDFSQSDLSIQRQMNQYKFIIQNLNQKAKELGLGIGRYYMVYENQKSPKKREVIHQLRQKTLPFELVLMSEMKDKV